MDEEEVSTAGFVYLLRSGTTGWYKIGWTRRPIEERVRELNYEHPGLRWLLIAYYEEDMARDVERLWHQSFTPYRVTKGKEWFTLPLEAVLLFQRMAVLAWWVEEFRQEASLAPVETE